MITSLLMNRSDLQVHLVLVLLLVLSLVDVGAVVSPADVTPMLAALESWSAPSLHLSIFFEDEKEDENDRPSLSLIPASLVLFVHHGVRRVSR